MVVPVALELRRLQEDDKLGCRLGFLRTLHKQRHPSLRDTVVKVAGVQTEEEPQVN